MLCGKKGKVQRQISFGGGIIFKGSGFYITDYKNPKKEKPAPDKKP
jgi:predicted nucleic acid-binding Zn ribbon protein